MNTISSTGLRILGAVAVLACLVLPDTAEARTYIVHLTPKRLMPGFTSNWDMFGCSSAVACVSNLRESDDGSLDVGLFAKWADQEVYFDAGTIAGVSAPNWSRATGVNSVEVSVYSQASASGSAAQACAVYAVSAYPVGGPGIETRAQLCNNRGSNPLLRRFNVLPPGHDATWTPALVSKTNFELTAFRDNPEGTRLYIAEFSVRISYQAP